MSAAVLRSSAAIPRAVGLVAPGPRFASAAQRMSAPALGCAAWRETQGTRTTPRDRQAHAAAAAAHDRAAGLADTAAAENHRAQAAAHRATLAALDRIARSCTLEAAAARGQVLARQATADAEATARGIRAAERRLGQDPPPSAARISCRTLTDAPGAPNPVGPARAA